MPFQIRSFALTVLLTQTSKSRKFLSNGDHGKITKKIASLGSVGVEIRLVKIPSLSRGYKKRMVNFVAKFVHVTLSFRPVELVAAHNDIQKSSRP